MNLSGKVVLITGAAQGIGGAAMDACAAAGAVVCGTDQQAMPDGIVGDLAEPGATDRIFDAALERHGRVDALVNAAGVTFRGSFLTADAALWSAVMAVNLQAPFFFMARLIAHLKSRAAPGAMVNVQSMNAHCGAADLAVYAASKGGLQTLTRNAAQAHMADRIRVNGINLGWVDTPAEQALHDGAQGAGWLAARATEQPLGRLVTAQECAAQIVWLLSDASAPLSGASLDLEQWVAGAPPG